MHTAKHKVQGDPGGTLRCSTRPERVTDDPQDRCPEVLAEGIVHKLDHVRGIPLGVFSISSLYSMVTMTVITTRVEHIS